MDVKNNEEKKPQYRWHAVLRGGQLIQWPERIETEEGK